MDGIIYSAVGESFADEALRSARSSLRFNRVPHLICTDQAMEVDDAGLHTRSLRPTATGTRTRSVR